MSKNDDEKHCFLKWFGFRGHSTTTKTEILPLFDPLFLAFLSKEFIPWCLALLQVAKCFVLVQIFWVSPKIKLHLVPLQKLLYRHKNQFYWMQIIFLSGTKCLRLAEYVNKFLVWHKIFGPTQNILRPVKGQGIRYILGLVHTKVITYPLCVLKYTCLIWRMFCIISYLFTVSFFTQKIITLTKIWQDFWFPSTFFIKISSRPFSDFTDFLSYCLTYLFTVSFFTQKIITLYKIFDFLQHFLSKYLHC